MTTAASSLCTVIALLLASAGLAEAQPDGALVYVEANHGLSQPRWEGGRSALVLADINRDGFIDILTVGDHGSPFINTNMAGITVWFGDGNGSWSAYQTGNFGYGGLDVADANNDGLLDVAYGIHHNYSTNDFGDQVLEVALGDGTGRNWTPWDQGLGHDGQTWGMFGTAFLDFDGDGWLDVASVSFGCCDGVHVYRNNRDGTWRREWGFLGGNSAMDVSVGDIDRDGYPDFAVAHQNGTVYANNGGGGHFTVADLGLSPIGLLGRRGPWLADVDGDGYDDLSMVNSNGGVEFYRRLAGPWVLSSAGLPAVGGYSVTRLVDMDGDGLLDLVAFGAGTLTIWKGDGGGTWTHIHEFNVPAPGTYSAIAIADIDRSGQPDIALVSRRQTGTFSSVNELRVFREATAASELSIRITSPTVNQVIRGEGGTMFDWITEVPGGVPSRVRLELSPDGPSGPWTIIADDLPDVGRHQMILPLYRESDEAHLRATVYAGVEAASDVVGPLLIRTSTPCYADCDWFLGMAALDVFDFLCFGNLFNQQRPYACNCDISTGLNVCDIFDFLCFGNEFAFPAPACP